jgi:glycine/D-amino acid oxidase-like deaminating enzyme
MPPVEIRERWGATPWIVDFVPPDQPLPQSVDFAIIGGGFTGLAAAAWLRLLTPGKSVVVLEASRIGAGASGRTGGMVLAEAASGDLPGLGNVLAGLQDILGKLEVQCDLALPGAWEIGRKGAPVVNSPISWNDSGTLRVVNEVPGGTLDPGEMVSGLARAASRLGAVICENRRVECVAWSECAELQLADGGLRARKVLFANNGASLDLSGLNDSAFPRLTLAALSAPLTAEQIEAIGLAERKPFYTVDFPYLWGRLRRDNSIVWGAGLVTPGKANDVREINIASEEPARMFQTLERRIRQLHPALEKTSFTHQWGGPILFREEWTPVFDRHPASANGIVLGAYAGHGVALSVYLGAWAAEALLDKRELPAWGAITPVSR